MISTIESVMLECDNCKDIYENANGFSLFGDETSMKEDADEDGWIEHEDKHYCSSCVVSQDEDTGVPQINLSRTKTK